MAAGLEGRSADSQGGELLLMLGLASAPQLPDSWADHACLPKMRVEAGHTSTAGRDRLARLEARAYDDDERLT
jgi:hypothetical protein